MVHHVGIAHNDDELEKLKRIGYEFIASELQAQEKNSQQTNLFNTPLAQTADHIEKKSHDAEIARLGRKCRTTIQEVLPPSSVTIDQIVETNRIIEGINETFGKIYDELGYNNILAKVKDRQLLKDLVLARISDPSSKHKTQEFLTKKFNKNYDIDRIYRLLDRLNAKIDTIKKLTFNNTKNLIPEHMNVVFFDVTTLYFESEKDDELRKYGYSKDHRFNTTQLVLALATNSDGLPIGYELFKGNQAEVGTLSEAIQKWREHFTIDSVCFVADRAMMSQKNIDLLEREGYSYVIAAKLRSMPKKIQAQILDGTNYKAERFGEELGWVGEFNYQAQRLIVSYKKTRAVNDSKHREKILEKLTKRLGEIGKKGATQKLLTNNGVRKYTTTTADAQTIIDNEKIKRDAEWDGIHGVLTNMKDVDALAILKRYSSLWVIEESFRINKHTLSMRPIFHFKKERIESHIALCYIAFSLLRYMQYKVSITTKISPDRIIEELNGVQASLYIHKPTGQIYRIPGAFTHVATKIYKVLGISRNLNASPYTQ
jgi:transposase